MNCSCRVVLEMLRNTVVVHIWRPKEQRGLRSQSIIYWLERVSRHAIYWNQRHSIFDPKTRCHHQRSYLLLLLSQDCICCGLYWVLLFYIFNLQVSAPYYNYTKHTLSNSFWNRAESENRLCQVPVLNTQHSVLSCVLYSYSLPGTFHLDKQQQ